MPVHDWTRVDAAIFHDFHLAWNAELRGALNSGLLPRDFYALIEQHTGRPLPELLTLPASPVLMPLPVPAVPQRRTVAIRHVSGHRLVALVEIVSPANKDRPESVRAFADKTEEALRDGIHVLVVDLFPAGSFDPQGIHCAIWSRFAQEPYDLPTDKPLTVASYLAEGQTEAWLEHLAVGDELPQMALFLTADVCIRLPLAATYGAAYLKAPAFWRDVLEGRRESISPD